MTAKTSSACGTIGIRDFSWWWRFHSHGRELQMELLRQFPTRLPTLPNPVDSLISNPVAGPGSHQQQTQTRQEPGWDLKSHREDLQSCRTDHGCHQTGVLDCRKTERDRTRYGPATVPARAGPLPKALTLNCQQPFEANESCSVITVAVCKTLQPSRQRPAPTPQHSTRPAVHAAPRKPHHTLLPIHTPASRSRTCIAQGQKLRGLS